MAALTLEPIDDWLDSQGFVTSWIPSAATLEAARNAPICDVPPSYQQVQHLRAYREHSARGNEMARLNIPSWNIEGKCDIRAMTFVINAYLRRHDTYHSWFEFDAAGEVLRRRLASPNAIKFVPADHGAMAPAEWQNHVLDTPNPLQWDCFRFGVIQRSDHFTFYVSIDHLHADAMFMGAVFVEIHMMYVALVEGGAPFRLPDAGSYLEYCVRQHTYTSALTLESPEVRTWIEFAESNDGSLPTFPLPLGDPLVPCSGALLTVELMNERESQQFNGACAEADARFSGGLLACAAIAVNELTGAETFSLICPTTTRRTAEDYQTTGWFTGVMPITVSVGDGSFYDTARAAQASFDSGAELANVPFDRVLELATAIPSVRKPRPGVPMLSYLEAGIAPLFPTVISQWTALRGRIYGDVGAANQLGMWVNRLGETTTITVAFPDNPVAHQSIGGYLEMLKTVCSRIARRHTGARPRHAPLPIAAP